MLSKDLAKTVSYHRSSLLEPEEMLTDNAHESRVGIAISGFIAILSSPRNPDDLPIILRSSYPIKYTTSLYHPPFVYSSVNAHRHNDNAEQVYKFRFTSSSISCVRVSNIVQFETIFIHILTKMRGPTKVYEYVNYVERFS